MVDHLNDLHVLVLDDHHNMRIIWRTILHAFGATQVYDAGDAAEAFEILKTEPIDIAIVDYFLKDLTGSEFTRLLREAKDSPTRHLPIVACTAHTPAAIVKELRDAGVDEVLAKPVSIAGAWAKFNSVIQARRAFVESPKFTGPDRRRRREGPPDEHDRRRGFDDVEIVDPAEAEAAEAVEAAGGGCGGEESPEA